MLLAVVELGLTFLGCVTFWFREVVKGFTVVFWPRFDFGLAVSFCRVAVFVTAITVVVDVDVFGVVVVDGWVVVFGVVVVDRWVVDAD